MKKSVIATILAASMLTVAFAGCSNNSTNNSTNSQSSSTPDAATSEYKDGVYRAELSEFSHGWKEYVEITIADGKITAVEADAFGEEDNTAKKSADENYKTSMMTGNEAQGKPATYPAEFYKKLSEDLVNKGDVDAVETVAGATNSSKTFKDLANAALENAKEGKTETAVVEAAAE